MSALETAVHSFIVRIWFEEEVDAKTGRLRWRGHITHVSSNRRQYFEDLEILKRFVIQFLQNPSKQET